MRRKEKAAQTERRMRGVEGGEEARRAAKGGAATATAMVTAERPAAPARLVLGLRLMETQ